MFYNFSVSTHSLLEFGSGREMEGSDMLRELLLKRYLFVLAIACAAILTFTGCTNSNSIVLSGTIESTQIDANSEVAGKVVSVLKNEGEVVKKGEVLANIDTQNQKLSVRQQQAAVKLKQAKLDELKAGNRDEQIKQAMASADAAKAKLDELLAGSRPEQIKQAEASVQSARIAVETAQKNLSYIEDKFNNIKSLHEKGSVSDSELQDAQNKLDNGRQQLLAAKSQQDAAKAQLDLLNSGATDQSIQAAKANYEQALAQLELLKKGATYQAIQAAQADLEGSQALLDQAKLNLERCSIKAPVDGTYILKNVNIGDMVNVGSSIGTISDLGDLWLKVYIPQRNIGAVKLNQEVELKSISLSGETIKGKIIFISDKAEFTPKNTETSEAKENTVFMIKIKVMNNIEKLKPGMSLDAFLPSGGK